MSNVQCNEKARAIPSPKVDEEAFYDSSDDSSDDGAPVTEEQWEAIRGYVWSVLNERALAVVAGLPEWDGRVEPEIEEEFSHSSAVQLQLAVRFGNPVRAEIERMREDIPQLIEDAMSGNPPPRSSFTFKCHPDRMTVESAAWPFPVDSPQRALVAAVTLHSTKELEVLFMVNSSSRRDPTNTVDAYTWLHDTLSGIAEQASSIDPYEKWVEDNVDEEEEAGEEAARKRARTE